MSQTPRFPLRRFLREQGKRGVVIAKTFVPTAAQEKKFERIIGKLIREWTVVLNTNVISEYSNAIQVVGQVNRIGLSLGGSGAVTRLEQALEAGAQRTAQFAQSLAPELETFALDFARWHMERHIAVIKQATGVDAQPFLSLSDTQDVLQAATRRNVTLIKGLDSDMRKRVEQTVLDAFNDRHAIKTLRRNLVDNLGFAPGRARIIAQDQIGKYTKELDRFRHEQLGIDRYVWVTVGDDRVRPSHVANEGKVFKWSRPPPETGHPGDDINCRCRAQAYIEPE